MYLFSNHMHLLPGLILTDKLTGCGEEAVRSGGCGAAQTGGGASEH
jgi:hypothetical protein